MISVTCRCSHEAPSLLAWCLERPGQTSGLLCFGEIPIATNGVRWAIRRRATEHNDRLKSTSFVRVQDGVKFSHSVPSLRWRSTENSKIANTHVKRRCLLVHGGDFSYRACCFCFVGGIAFVLSKAFGKTASRCFPSRHSDRVWSRVCNTKLLKEREESLSENFKNRPYRAFAPVTSFVSLVPVNVTSFSSQRHITT